MQEFYQIYKKLNQQYTLNFISCYSKDPKHLYFLFEQPLGEEFTTFMTSKKEFNDDEAKFYISQLVLGIDFLHSKNILYRNLKPETILITMNGYIKLVDFTYARITQNKCYTIIGRPQYLAPEIILSKGYRQGADWFSLGVLCYEMLVGENPYVDEDPFMIYSKIIKGKVKYPSHLDKDANKFLSGLLATDPNKRLGCLRNNVMDIINHKWFKGFSWEDIADMKAEAVYLPEILYVFINLAIGRD